MQNNSWNWGKILNTNGQLLIGSSGSNPVASFLTSNSNTITITPGPGSLNIDVNSSTSLSTFSDFYALMPPNNAATVAPGTAVAFPQTGSSNGVITALTSSSFNLPVIGTYQVQFQVSTDEPGQLQLSINGTPDATSVVGRATGTNQIIGISLITTITANSVLRVINPAGNSTALTITPIAGGTHPVSAHLTIIRIN